jgi:hypothetical protein
MKIDEWSKVFRPFTITIESPEEEQALRHMLLLLTGGAALQGTTQEAERCHMFQPDTVPRDMIDQLQALLNRRPTV